MAWNMEILVIFITLVSWMFFYKRMIPLMPIEEPNNFTQCNNLSNNMTSINEIGSLNNQFQSPQTIETHENNLKKC